MIFIPHLSAFLNGNSYYGSKGALRFRVRGVLAGAPGEEQTPVLEACTWRGPNGLEDSTVEAQADFPLSQAGRESLLAWLEEQAAAD